MFTELLGQSKWFSILMVVNVLLSFLGQDEVLVKEAEPQQLVQADAASGMAALSTSDASTSNTTSNHDANQNGANYSAAEPVAPINDPIDNENRAKSELASIPTARQQSEQNSYRFIPNLDSDFTKFKAIEVVATGYYAGKESTGKNPDHPEYGITYSGVKVKRDDKALSTIAADPDVFPLGTVLFIPGYGYGVVADTGSAIKGKKIDLYFDTKDQVYKEWGKRTIKVFIVKKGSGKVTEFIWNQLKDEIISSTKAL